MAEQHHHTESEKGPSASQVLAVVTLFPVGGVLLSLSGIILAAIILGAAVSFPIFLLCSPIIVPAVIVIGLAVAGFLTSGAFGITALSSIVWIIDYFRKMRGSWPELFDQARRRVEDTASHVDLKVREAGQKAEDAVRS